MVIFSTIIRWSGSFWKHWTTLNSWVPFKYWVYSEMSWYSMFLSNSPNVTHVFFIFSILQIKWCPNTNTWEPLLCFTAAATYWAVWVTEWGQTADTHHVLSEQNKRQGSDPTAPFNYDDGPCVKCGLEGGQSVSPCFFVFFTLRFLCGWRSGWGGGLGPGFDGGPVVTWFGDGTFLCQPWRTQVVHWSTLVLQRRGGREVWRGEKDNISYWSI